MCKRRLPSPPRGLLAVVGFVLVGGAVFLAVHAALTWLSDQLGGTTPNTILNWTSGTVAVAAALCYLAQFLLFDLMVDIKLWRARRRPDEPPTPAELAAELEAAQARDIVKGATLTRAQVAILAALEPLITPPPEQDPALDHGVDAAPADATPIDLDQKR